MATDMNILKMLRWRYDHLLHPSEIVDEKMLKILMVPPARAQKQSIIIQDVTHEVNTRAKVQADERRNLVEQRRKGTNERRNLDEQRRKTFAEETEEMNQLNDSLLEKVSRGLYVYIDFGMGQKQLELEMTDVNLLMTKKALISNTIMYIAQL